MASESTLVPGDAPDDARGAGGPVCRGAAVAALCVCSRPGRQAATGSRPGAPAAPRRSGPRRHPPQPPSGRWPRRGFIPRDVKSPRPCVRGVIEPPRRAAVLRDALRGEELHRTRSASSRDKALPAPPPEPPGPRHGPPRGKPRQGNLKLGKWNIEFGRQVLSLGLTLSLGQQGGPSPRAEPPHRRGPGEVGWGGWPGATTGKSSQPKGSTFNNCSTPRSGSRAAHPDCLAWVGWGGGVGGR